MQTDKDIPQIDLPDEEWIVGTDISEELLSLYANYPVRLKCEGVALLMAGEVEASMNLHRMTVRPNDLITLPPGTIFQIHKVSGPLRIYFLGFSSAYIHQCHSSSTVLASLYSALNKPNLSLRPEGAVLLEEYMNLLIRLYDFLTPKMRRELAPNLYNDIHKGVYLIYQNHKSDTADASKSEQICRKFAQLVMTNYAKTRNVAWYAEKLGITDSHLCTTIKQTTGNTCGDIIASMVIMDAKSQLKSTDLSIQTISESLNFANMSFFGKYFKRHVGMSPLEYRNTQ